MARPGKDQPLSSLMRAHWEELQQHRDDWLHLRPMFVKRSWTLFVAKAVVEVVAEYRAGGGGGEGEEEEAEGGQGAS